MTHKQTAVEMTAADLKKAGFAVRHSLSGDLIVSLDCKIMAGSEVVVEVVTG